MNCAAGAVLADVRVFAGRSLVALGRRMGRVRRRQLLHSHSALVHPAPAADQTTPHTRQPASGLSS